MKASDLKALLLLLSFAPSSLSLNSFFSSEHSSSSGLAERGARLRSIRKAPSLPPRRRLCPPIFPLPLSLLWATQVHSGAPLLLFLRSFKTQNNTTIDMPAMPAKMPGCRPLATLSIANNDASRN